MTAFVLEGEKTERPEELSILGKIRVILTGVRVPRPRNESDPSSLELPFETLYFENDRGIELEAWWIGEDDRSISVILFHGYSSSKASLLPIAEGLAALGARSLLVDFYGSGGSGGNGTTIGVLEANDVVAALRFARSKRPDDSIVLYGVSMGGSAVLRAIALEEAKPDAIVLESPFNRLSATTARRFELMGLPAWPLNELLLFWGGVQSGFDPFDHNPEQYASAVRCPALVLHGALDTRATPAQARRVYDAISSEKTFELFPKAEHEVLVVANRRAWRRTVGTLLDSL
ncbi:MAG: alpha/beta fold hydrolase [bacterium]|nr:alpha/beta fold hydrolase [bacterium]